MAVTGSITIFDRTQNAADQAATAAAQKTADDTAAVVRVRTDGLHVGKSDSDCEVLVTNEDVQVVKAGQTFSRFAANYTQHGSYQMRETADGGLAFVFV